MFSLLWEVGSGQMSLHQGGQGGAKQQRDKQPEVPRLGDPIGVLAVRCQAVSRWLTVSLSFFI